MHGKSLLDYCRFLLIVVFVNYVVQSIPKIESTSEKYRSEPETDTCSIVEDSESKSHGCLYLCDIYRTSFNNVTKKLSLESCEFFKRCKNCTDDETIFAVAVPCAKEFKFINKRCLLKCNSNWMFDDDNKDFAKNFMLWLSAICFVVSSVTIVTIVVLSRRSRTNSDNDDDVDDYCRRYPDRAILYICLCYCFYSMGYLLRCLTPSGDVGCVQLFNDDDKYFVSGEFREWKCVIIFTILFYFENAKMFWWIFLTVSWYLEAVKKWAPDAKEWRKWLALLFHVAAWSVPAFMVAGVWFTSSIEGQELTKLCYVVKKDSSTSLGFVMVPTTIFLSVGVFFCIRSVYGMKNVQRILKRENRETDLLKLRKNSIYVRSFALIFCIPVVFVVCCDVYETLIVNIWTRNRVHCVGWDHRDAYERNYECVHQQQPRPIVEFFIMKIFFSLITGLALPFWILKRKYFTSSWNRFWPESRSLKLVVMFSGYKRAKLDQATSQF